MSRDSLEALARRWVPGAGPVVIQAVSAGVVNATYQVWRAGRCYSLRVAAVQDLGLDREWECRVLRLAASAGLAAGVVTCEPTAGVLVSRWIAGRPLTLAESRPDASLAVARLLQQVHALPIPQPARQMSPATWIEYYVDAMGRWGIAASPAATGLRARVVAGLAELALLPAARPVVCHSDVHRDNLVYADGLVLLDWEYAHVADGFWDLAGWAANNDWSSDAAAPLLAHYLGRQAEPLETNRLALLMWLYDYVCVLWSELYLNQRADADADSIAVRRTRLLTRLNVATGSRAPQVPAH